MTRWAALVGLAGGLSLLGAACAPKASASRPYLQRTTVSGERAFSLDTCVDPAAMRQLMDAVKARAPSPRPGPQLDADHIPRAAPPGCTRSFQRRADGSIHSEMACDRAAGARASYRRTTDGTPQDMRMHLETFGFDPITGAPKTTVRDTHTVRLGPCPADLKPGQARGPDGIIFSTPSPATMLARLQARKAAESR